MTVRRFYCANIDQASVELNAADAAHARRVLRLSVGQTVELFDGCGATATATIVDMGKRLVVEPTERRFVERPKPVIDVAAAVPKGARADVLVEKLSELGADRLIPLLTDRTVVEPRQGKIDRFGRMAIESAKQCGRAWLMAIDEPTAFGDVLGAADHDVKLMADVQELQVGGSAGAMLKHAARVLVLIGPEGGWTDAERRAAQDAGCVSWRLGPHVLRVETAAIAAVACLRQPT